MTFLVSLLAAIFSITANPGENCDTQMNLSWAADGSTVRSYVLYKKSGESDALSLRADSKGTYCPVYNNEHSKTAGGENFYEDARFFKHGVSLDGLKPDCDYEYRIFAISSEGDTAVSRVGRFHTSGARHWKACVISDFHTYPPLPGRLDAAMGMMEKIEKRYGYDWVLSLGDVCAWGGSWSFWKEMYSRRQFADYMWGGVNGNHDNMTRHYRLTNEFFRNATNNPLNGYEGEMGVCYWFRYGDALFIMLNNEDMRDQAGFEKAFSWVDSVLEANADARYKVVCEHYQWFFGTDGKTSQYGRWHELFEKHGVDLALAGNNHIYVRAHSEGVTYVQTPSSDDERGQDPVAPLAYNSDKIDFRWNEGPHTVGAILLDVTPSRMRLSLLDRNGKVLDKVNVRPKLNR